MKVIGFKPILGAAFVLCASLFVANGTVNAISGTVTLNGQKVTSGMPLSEGQYTFELRKAGSDTVLQTTTNKADGSIVFENVSYSDEDVKGGKYITYEITEVAGNDSSIVYDNNVGYAILELEEGGGEIAEITYTKPVIEDISYDYYENPMYYASESELEGVAYAVFDSKDKTLTFFRAPEGAYEDKSYVYLTEEGAKKESGYSDWYRYYEVVNETSDTEGFGYRLNNQSHTNYAFASQVKSVVFKDAVKPKLMRFQNFSACEKYDLSKLDTSNMISMKSMFAHNTSLKAINISSFVTSNTTDMSEMFESDQNLERIVWGYLDTSRVKYIWDFANETALEYFDFSRIDTTSLENADSMVRGMVDNPMRMQKLDFSSWGNNGTGGIIDGQYQSETYYTTATIATVFHGEYLDISSWQTTYSAEFYDMSRLKVAKLCLSGGEIRTPILGQDDEWLNIGTGEVANDSTYGSSGMYCGTFVKLGNNDMEFVNRKKVSIDVEKVNESGAALSGARLGLEMDGSLVDTWTTDGNRKTFGDLAYGHDYAIVEIEAPQGYKKAEPIEFSVSNEGVLTSDGETISLVSMKDEPDVIKVKKQWIDEGAEKYRPESLTFEIYRVYDDTKIGELTLSEENGWTGEFADFERYSEEGLEYSFKVVESGNMANYNVSYALEGSDEIHHSSQVGDSVIVTNEFTEVLIDYPFEKRWEGDSEDARPESVKFKIYESIDAEEAIDELELSADDAGEDANVWSGKFENLRKHDDNGKLINYVIKEDAVEGYEATYLYDESLDVAEDGYIYMLRVSCNFGNAGGGYYGPIVDISDDTTGKVKYMLTGAYNDSDIYYPLQGTKYQFLNPSNATCSGAVVYDDESKLSSAQSSEMMVADYEARIGSYEEVLMTGSKFSNVTGNKVITIDMSEFSHEKSETESDKPFAGANIILNKKVEESAEQVNTLDKIMPCFVAFALAGSGIAAVRFAQRRR